MTIENGMKILQICKENRLKCAEDARLSRFDE